MAKDPTPEVDSENDDTFDALRAAWNEDAAQDDDDAGGLDAPLEQASDTDDKIAASDADERILNRAEDPKHTETDKQPGDTPSEEDEAAAKPEKAEVEAKADEGDKKDDDKPAEPDTSLQSAEVGALTEGLPKERAAEIERRLTQAKPLSDLYAKYAPDLQRHGQDPAQAMERLVQINQYALQKPGEYLAWAAQNIAPDKIEDVLTEAAKAHGFKLSKADVEVEDDEFLDDRTRAILEENKRLKAQAGPQIAGPDNPEMQRVRQFNEWVNEAGPDGQPMRPLFHRYEQDIARLAQAHVQQTGQPVTMDDLDRMYLQLENADRAKLGLPARDRSSAAPASPPVQDMDKAAPDARKASKSLDVSSQRAARRPAQQNDNSDIADIVRQYMG